MIRIKFPAGEFPFITASRPIQGPSASFLVVDGRLPDGQATTA